MLFARGNRGTQLKSRIVIAVFVVGTTSPSLSCQYGGSGPRVASTGGLVTWQGEPVVGALVTFVPDREKGTSGPMAVGTTDGQGRYTLKTSGTRQGAIIGDHRVTISLSSDPYSDMPPGASGALPAKFSDASTSGLTASVLADEPNTIDFVLK